MKFKSLFGLALSGFLMTTTAHADPKPVSSAKELVGCYERINFSPEFTKLMNPKEYWPEPYQWFCFDSDGKFSSMMSTQHSEQTAAQLRQTLNRLPQVFRYDYVTSGVINTETVPGQPVQKLYWQVTFMDKNITTPDGTLVGKNTVVMGLIDPETDKVVYWRYLNKLK